MLLFKQQVAADTKYSFSNQANCVLFDAHNDSPYNMGISFGRDTGPDNADYYTSPHSVLAGVGPVGNAPSINNVRWNGTVYIYTETPLGTGSTDLTTAPAFQISVIGYPVGYQPFGITSMSRMTSTPNTVSTNAMTVLANAISTLGDAVNTPIITAKPSDVAVQNTWDADNSGNLTVRGDNGGLLTTLLQLIAGASPAVKIAAASIIAEVLGGLKVDGTFESAGAATLDSTLAVTGTSNFTGTATFNAATVTNSLSVQGTSSLDNGAISTNGSGTATFNQSIKVNANLDLGDASSIYRAVMFIDGSNRLNIQAATAGGTIQLDDSNGTAFLTATSSAVAVTPATTFSNNLTCNGNYIWKNGNTISRVSTFTGTGSGTYSHNLGSAPTWVGPIVNVSGSATQGFDTPGTTTVHCTLGASLAFTAFCTKNV